jgi:hypothetical protein
MRYLDTVKVPSRFTSCGSVAACLFVLLAILRLNAEDWTTTDGKTYKNVAVVSHDTKVVTVNSSDGLATFPIAFLNEDLQKRVLNDNATAKDWAVNGRNYHNVVVGQVEADVVHISYDGGVGTVPLADLPPDLQKRLNYSPAAAKAASQQRNAAMAAQSKEVQDAQTEEGLREQFAQQVEKAKQTPLGTGFSGIVFNVFKLSKNLNGYLTRTYNGHFIGNYMQWDGPVVLLVDSDHDYVDDDHADYPTIYCCGTWQYTTTTGATSTVRVYTPKLDCAIQLYRSLNKSD